MLERTNRQLTIYIKHITGPGQGGARREQWGSLGKVEYALHGPGQLISCQYSS